MLNHSFKNVYKLSFCELKWIDLLKTLCVNDERKCQTIFLRANSDKTPITAPNKKTAPLKTLNTYCSQTDSKIVDH